MKTPYEILGVGRNASDQQITEAYERIVEKYNAEEHENHPLGHLAAEKIEEAKQAYENIMAKRSDEREGNTTQSSPFLDIRRLLNENRPNEAEEILAGVPEAKRDAEWYFLKGTIQHGRGWLEEAYENFTLASQMNPHNSEYRAALNQLQWQRQTGRGSVNPAQTPEMRVTQCGVCDICTTMCCANMCCNCLGGC